ncbi:MAG TPA: hypothetical protein P5287_05655 [bacterium]|nr:hypothetical protein [bacterium]
MKKIVVLGALLAYFALGAGYVLAQGTAVTDSVKTDTVAGGKTYVCDACKVTMDTPGSCPVCGVALVETVVAEDPALSDEASAPDRN